MAAGRRECSYAVSARQGKTGSPGGRGCRYAVNARYRGHHPAYSTVLPLLLVPVWARGVICTPVSVLPLPVPVPPVPLPPFPWIEGCLHWQGTVYTGVYQLVQTAVPDAVSVYSGIPVYSP